MQQIHSEQSEQHPRVYTAEEAGEILKRAVRLQEERLTTQQLYSIAEEAGIRRETLEQAIWEHERAKIASQFQKSQKPLGRWARFKRAIRRLFVATILFTMGFFTRGIVVDSSRSNFSDSYEPPFQVLASSSKLSVLYYPDARSVVIESVDSEDSRVLNTAAYSKPRVARISPSSSFIAIQTYEGHVYVVRSDGTGLQEVVIPSQLVDQLLKRTRKEYYYLERMSGWCIIDGKEFLVLQIEVSDYPHQGFEPAGVLVRYDPKTGAFAPHTSSIRP